MTAVASFESVGNILVVAMFVVPPAAAYMLTDKLSRMSLISVVLAILSAVLGHVAAIEVPQWFGYRSTTTAGMMAVVSGGLLLIAVGFGPRHGVLARVARRKLLAWQILSDDIVALLYRMKERDGVELAVTKNLRATLLADSLSFRLVLGWLERRQRIHSRGGHVRLTDKGEDSARGLVRSHRLWEQYLLSHASIEPERLHDKAERFEHFTNRELRDELNAATNAPETDPHGAPIPSEQPEES